MPRNFTPPFHPSTHPPHPIAAQRAHEENVAIAAAEQARAGDAAAAERALRAERPSLWGRHSEAQALRPEQAEALRKLQLPELRGETVVEHFDQLARRQAAPYLDRVELLADLALAPLPLPSDAAPAGGGFRWSRAPGWTFYPPDGSAPRPVEAPAEEALVLDVEVAVRESDCPVLATAVGPNGWYGWVSPRMAHELQLLEGASHGATPPPPSLLNLEVGESHGEEGGGVGMGRRSNALGRMMGGDVTGRRWPRRALRHSRCGPQRWAPVATALVAARART